MKTRTLSLMLAVLTAGGVSQLAAQGPRFSLGAGLTVPAGGYGTADGAGWHVLGAGTWSSQKSLRSHAPNRRRFR